MKGTFKGVLIVFTLVLSIQILQKVAKLQFEGPNLYLVFCHCHSHNAYQQCLPSSSVQSYRINIAKALWLWLWQWQEKQYTCPLLQLLLKCWTDHIYKKKITENDYCRKLKNYIEFVIFCKTRLQRQVRKALSISSLQNNNLVPISLMHKTTCKHNKN